MEFPHLEALHSGLDSGDLRILIVDDDALVRAGLRAVLGSEPDIDVVGEAGNGFHAIEVIEELEPDVVLLDISMPGGGLAALREIGRAINQMIAQDPGFRATR